MLKLQSNPANMRQQWENNLQKYQSLASTGHYPGSNAIEEGTRLCGIILDAKESFGFISRMDENRNELSDFAEEYHEIDTFYSTQRPTWDRLREAKGRFDINSIELEKDEQVTSREKDNQPTSLSHDA